MLYKDECWELPSNMNIWVVIYFSSHTALFPLTWNGMFQDFYIILILKAIEIASPDVIK